MRRQAKKASKGSKAPAPTILLIGGPADSADSRVTRVPCDFAGIMRAPPFRDYPVVIYWPDKSFASLPRTAKAWRETRSRDSSLPAIPIGYWTNRRKAPPEVDVSWYGNPRLPEPTTESYRVQSQPPRAALWHRLTVKVENGQDVENIDRFLRYTCLEKLMALVLGAQAGQTIVCVVPRRDRVDHAYDWVSCCIDIVDRRDVQVRVADLCGTRLETARETTASLAQAITEWPIILRLAGDPDSESLFKWTGLWRDHMLSTVKDDDRFAADFFSSSNHPPPLEVEGNVLIYPGHQALDQAAKSLLFLSGLGMISLIPEPSSLGSLLKALHEKASSPTSDRTLPSGIPVRVASDGRSIFVNNKLYLTLTSQEGDWMRRCMAMYEQDGEEEFNLRQISREAFTASSKRIAPSQIFRTHGSRNFFTLFEKTEPGVVRKRDNVVFEPSNPKNA